MTEEERKIDRCLFDNAFFVWLEAHGVTIGENVGQKFVATIDLNKLKVAILRLAPEERS